MKKEPFRAGCTETQAIKQAMTNGGYIWDYLKSSDESQWPWAGREGRKLAKRPEKRLRKKLRQPYRRKARGPLRAKAAGKNEVRPQRN